ncbi:MAG: hypothetical protein GY760_09845 [Deltaproteobacteria bacterium]|nr:hypothetical protein [Deltaproteobacteria bacterium]
MVKHKSKFEGPEKKLEILLNKKLPDLKDNSCKKWDRVVKKSHAKIISYISNGTLDAYLLSESSLFVWDDRILMITCGDTTLVDAIPDILEIIGDAKPVLFYECRNFNFPKLQPSDFDKDIEKIKKHIDGSFCRLGPSSSNHINVFSSEVSQTNQSADETLQILMDDFDPSLLDKFSNGNGNNVNNIITKTGIADIYDGMKLDAYLFSPHGFSINGILNKSYFTIHVTPQSKFSYVSFETNFIEDNYTETIKKVVSIFKPEHFSVILTTNQNSTDDKMYSVNEGYKITENEHSTLNSGYKVVFRNYRKEMK